MCSIVTVGTKAISHNLSIYMNKMSRISSDSTLNIQINMGQLNNWFTNNSGKNTHLFRNYSIAPFIQIKSCLDS